MSDYKPSESTSYIINVNPYMSFPNREARISLIYSGSMLPSLKVVAATFQYDLCDVCLSFLYRAPNSLETCACNRKPINSNV